MIQCLRPGLLSLENTPRVCIQAFTVMLMEILELILRHLADILFDMSRMSTTLNVAVPVLEFLSSKHAIDLHFFSSLEIILIRKKIIFIQFISLSNIYIRF